MFYTYEANNIIFIVKRDFQKGFPMYYGILTLFVKNDIKIQYKLHDVNDKLS